MSKQLEAYGYKEIHSLAQKSVTNFSGSLCGNMPLNLKQAEISELRRRKYNYEPKIIWCENRSSVGSM